MRQILALVAVVLLGPLDIHSQQGSTTEAASIRTIDRKDFTNPDQYAFLAPILREVEVVSLGESIHITHEFPLVRLGIVRYLGENLGFHVLVMEGSAPDVWVAQDRLLNSARTEQDAQRVLGGFFGLWNTSEMRMVLEYEAESWHTPHPLYVAGYDVQAGNGYGFQGTDVFRQLIERLATYATPPEGFDPTRWLRSIQLIGGEYHPEDRPSIEAGIQTLQDWIERARPEIEKRFPNVPHATALRLIPDNLRAVLEFHQDLAQPNPQGYQGLRDTSAANYVLEVKRAVAGQKLMLWAHISHLHNDNERGPASVGGILRSTLGSRLYTIGLFAESGGATLIFPGNRNEDIGYGRIHGARGGLGHRLSNLSKYDYFLDLRSLPTGPSADPVFWTLQPMAIESGQGRLIVARAFDGIIWIKTVHAPDFTPLVLVLSLVRYRDLLIVISIGLILSIILLAVHLLVRRRRRWRDRVSDSLPVPRV